MTDTTPTTYTVDEAADMLGVSRQRVSQLVKQGTISADRTRTPMLLDAADIRRWQNRDQLPAHLLTLEQAADRHGASYGTIKNWVRTGKLETVPHPFHDRRHLVRRQDLDRLPPARVGRPPHEPVSPPPAERAER